MKHTSTHACITVLTETAESTSRRCVPMFTKGEKKQIMSSYAHKKICPLQQNNISFVLPSLFFFLADKICLKNENILACISSMYCALHSTAANDTNPKAQPYK